MKTIVKAFLIATLSIILLNSNVLAGNTESDNNYITREYKITPFDRIEANTVANIIFTQSTDGKATLKIYGREDIVELVNVDLKGGVLKLGFDKQVKTKNYKLTITISSPTLSSVYFKGVGDILIENGLKTSSLNINSQGVGNVKLYSLDCDDITIESSGVGNVELTGTAKKAFLDSKGVGNIDAADLVSSYVDASCKGVGNITCHATETIDASVKGVGSIKYKGNPTNKNIEKKGFGSIKSY